MVSNQLVICLVQDLIEEMEQAGRTPALQTAAQTPCEHDLSARRWQVGRVKGTEAWMPEQSLPRPSRWP